MLATQMRAAITAASAKYGGPDLGGDVWTQPRVQQLTCETRQHCDKVTYELHCFLDPRNPAPEVYAKYQECVAFFNEQVSGDAYPMKSPLICLRYRPSRYDELRVDMHESWMQSSRYAKADTTDEAMELLRLNACFWKACGFSVARAKLEAVAQTVDLPTMPEEALAFDAYYETHMRVAESSDPDAPPTVQFLHALTDFADNLSAEFGWPVCVAYNGSRDPQLLAAVNKDGWPVASKDGKTGQLFINHRMRHVTQSEFKDRQNVLAAEVAKRGWKVERVVSEVVVFETTTLGDRGGFDPTTSTVVLVSGKRFSGKTTFVQELRAQLRADGVQVNEVTIAEPGKAEYCLREMCDPSALKNRATKEQRHRKGMQDLMSEMGAVHPERFLWPVLTKIAELDMRTSSVIVVSDVRRKSEWFPLRQACERMVGPDRVLCVRLEMSEAEAKARGWQASATDTHVTETDLDDLPDDVWCFVRKPGTLAAEFARRVIAQGLKPVMWQ